MKKRLAFNNIIFSSGSKETDFPVSKHQENYEKDFKIIENRDVETDEERKQRELRKLLGIF